MLLNFRTVFARCFMTFVALSLASFAQGFLWIENLFTVSGKLKFAPPFTLKWVKS